MKKWIAAGLVTLILIISAVIVYNVNKNTPDFEFWEKNYQYEAEEVFPIQLDEFGLPYTEVMVNDGVFNMLFSTGNITGIQIELDKARSLRLPRIDKWTGIDVEGNSTGKYSVFRSSKISAFGFTWEDQKVFESSNDEIEGIFSIKMLMDKRFTIDYKNKLIGVTGSTSAPYIKDCVVLPLVKSKDNNGMLVVKGEVNGNIALIHFDTGRDRTAIDRRLAKKLDLLTVEDGYKVDAISLGKYSFDLQYAKGMNLKSLEQGFREPVMLSLGSDILSQMVITVDYQRGVMIISQ